MFKNHEGCNVWHVYFAVSICVIYFWIRMHVNLNVKVSFLDPVVNWTSLHWYGVSITGISCQDKTIKKATFVDLDHRLVYSNSLFAHWSVLFPWKPSKRLSVVEWEDGQSPLSYPHDRNEGISSLLYAQYTTSVIHIHVMSCQSHLCNLCCTCISLPAFSIFSSPCQ